MPVDVASLAGEQLASHEVQQPGSLGHIYRARLEGVDTPRANLVRLQTLSSWDAGCRRSISLARVGGVAPFSFATELLTQLTAAKISTLAPRVSSSHLCRFSLVVTK